MARSRFLLYKGTLKGTKKNVWYILTDVDDQGVAEELGLNFSAKLTFASNAARTGNLDANGNIVFDKGTVNFAPEQKHRSRPDGSGISAEVVRAWRSGRCELQSVCAHRECGERNL